jgi:hypothetical protein
MESLLIYFFLLIVRASRVYDHATHGSDAIIVNPSQLPKKSLNSFWN